MQLKKASPELRFETQENGVMHKRLPTFKLNWFHVWIKLLSRYRAVFSFHCFMQGPTITSSTGPSAARFGSYYKYMNAAPLKRNEEVTLVSSKTFQGVQGATKLWGLGCEQITHQIFLKFRYDLFSNKLSFMNLKTMY